MSAGPLSLAEAEHLVAERLGVSPRAAHSRFVSLVMQQLAAALGADAELWQLVGLVHDLDYFAVDGDWSRHGVVTAAWLAGRLPDDALAAIAAHDHRTGVRSSTQLAELLRLADGLAVLDETAGREPTVTALRAEALETVTGSRPFLVGIIGGTAARHGVGLATLAGLLAALPRQDQR